MLKKQQRNNSVEHNRFHCYTVLFTISLVAISLRLRSGITPNFICNMLIMKDNADLILLTQQRALLLYFFVINIIVSEFLLNRNASTIIFEVKFNINVYVGSVLWCEYPLRSIVSLCLFFIISLKLITITPSYIQSNVLKFIFIIVPV